MFLSFWGNWIQVPPGGLVWSSSPPGGTCIRIHCKRVFGNVTNKSPTGGTWVLAGPPGGTCGAENERAGHTRRKKGMFSRSNYHLHAPVMMTRGRTSLPATPFAPSVCVLFCYGFYGWKYFFFLFWNRKTKTLLNHFRLEKMCNSYVREGEKINI